MGIVPVVTALKMRVVVVGKKDSIGKLRTQRAQNHEFVVNVRTEQTDGPNSVTILALPTRGIFFHLPRQSPEIIRLIQPFRGLDRDGVLAKLSFLFLLALTVFAEVAWQPTVDSTKIMIRVNPRRLLL